MDLNSPVSTVPFVGPTYAKRLKLKLELSTVRDLLWHVPFRYDDLRQISKITDFPLGETRTIKAEVIGFKNQYTNSGKQMQIAEIYDGTGNILCIWFNQRYLSNSLPIGTVAYFAGELSWWKKNKAIYNPDFEIYNPSKPSLHTGRLVPIYHETYGVSSKWLRSRIFEVLSKLQRSDIEDFLSDELLQKYDLINLFTSMQDIHFPREMESAVKARRRLAIEELVALQLESLFNKINWQKNEVAKQFRIDEKKLHDFVQSLPFSLTQAQDRVISEILADLQKPTPMNRLLEGDVGSGKTVVAAIGAYIAYLNGQKTAVMAPTQILAQQHFDTLTNLFKDSKLKVSSDGSGDVVVNTHALIHKNVELGNVGFVVIDEQHRFGVEQRTHLISKSKNASISPHVLTMTATPIPRTIALTMYGDLDLSILDQLPKGRIPVTTWLVPPQKREGGYSWIKHQIQNSKSQVFVVCPLIEESEAESLIEVKSAKAEYERLLKIFSGFKIGLLHGRLKLKEKNLVLNEFRDGKLDILVTTPVVEVGVDIPGANIMMIETAERFGLASLHQLRGRVGRGKQKSYCLLMTESRDEKAIKRLGQLSKHNSGFELAEVDLKMRGPGEILGTAQHGFGRLKVANWQDFDLIKISREIAQFIVANQANFAKLLSGLKIGN